MGARVRRSDAAVLHRVYVNNLGSEGSDRVRDAYRPATYARLVGLKDRYDPSNALRFNQNIQPSSG